MKNKIHKTFVYTMLIIEILVLSAILIYSLAQVQHLLLFAVFLAAEAWTIFAIVRCYEDKDEEEDLLCDESTAKFVERLRKAKANSDTATHPLPKTSTATSTVDQFNHCVKKFAERGITTVFEASTDPLYDCLIHFLDGELFIYGKKTGILENDILEVKYYINEENNDGYIKLQLKNKEKIRFYDFDFDGILFIDNHRWQRFRGSVEFFDLLEHRIHWDQKNEENT